MNDSVQGKSELRNWTVTGLKDTEFILDKGCAEYPNHVHDAYTLDLIVSGSFEYRLGNRIYQVNAGNLVWIDPHEVHGGRQVGNEPVAIRSILLPRAFVRTLQTSDSASVVIHNGSLFEDAKNLHRASENCSELFEMETRLIKSVGCILMHSENASVFNKTEHQAVKGVKEYMLANYSEPINIHRLAELSQLDVSYLIRVFHSQVGLPPYDYLTKVRVARARVLLSEGMQPADVAAAVGLSDQSHLTRLFKRTTGMTPGSYTRALDH